jgi:nitrite reductase/ring-hydroxylating ferredoxin subunit/Fe-S cluster biogenesis protein NfuA
MNDPQPPPGAEQAAREDLLDEVQQLITALEAHSDPAVGTQLKALLEGIDTVHRAALTHLVGAILAEEAIDLVRGHLHSHGIDVELVEVVGGVVYVRLHGLERSGHDADAVLRDLEAALREGLVGFQEVVLRERERAATFVRLGGVRRAHKPVYHRVAASAELGNGELLAVSLGAQQLILARVNGEAFALAGCCGDTPLPLRFSQLDGYTLECSWHGCQYDVRTGAYTGRRASRPGMPGDDSAPPGQRLAVFPVREENGDILVAVAVAPVDPKGT